MNWNCIDMTLKNIYNQLINNGYFTNLKYPAILSRS